MKNLKIAKLRENVLTKIKHQYDIEEIERALDEYLEAVMVGLIEAPTCGTCGSADTYTTTAYHCRRCATTTEM